MNNQMAIFSFFSEKKDFKRMANSIVGWFALFLFSLLGLVSTNTLASSDITNTQPTTYQWDVLAVGSQVYIDRNFTYTVVPSGFQNLSYLRTANSDKSATDKAVSFEVSEAVTVYVAYDDRNAEIPEWLQSWTRTETVLLNSDVGANLRLYSSDYMAGTVTLGSNEADKNSMYTVIVRAKSRLPEVVSIRTNADDATTIKVVFSEAVTADSAENSSNYSFTPEIPVSSAQLSADGTMVTLLITGELSEGDYTLTASNIEDKAANIIAADSQTNFTYTSALVIDNVQQETYQQGILRVDSKVYIDRDFIYTTIPERFQNLKYLRTANNDKMGAAEGFLSFDVNQAVTVYVAYDERYPQQPEWLQDWMKTEEILKTTDVDSNPAGVNLALYSKEYEAGTVTLGGNEAENEDDNSMYTVIISSQKDDILLPKVIAVSADSDNNKEVKVEFSEVITVESAEDPSNYSISPDASVLTAELDINDTIIVKLTTEALSEGVDYVLTVNNIEDTAANTITPNSQINFTLESGDSTGGTPDEPDTGGGASDSSDTPDNTDTPNNGEEGGGGGGGGTMGWLGMLLLTFGVLKVGYRRYRKNRVNEGVIF